MIEYRPVALSRLSQDLLKLLERRKFRLVFETHSLGDFDQLDLVTGNRMNLQVVHQLQSVLQFAKPLIVLRQDRRLRCRQTLGSLQSANCIECIGGSDC